MKNKINLAYNNKNITLLDWNQYGLLTNMVKMIQSHGLKTLEGFVAKGERTSVIQL